MIPRRIARRVDKRSHKPATISNGKLHGRRRCPLVVASGIVRVPDQNARHAGIHTCRHEEGHAVLDLGVGDVGDDRVADDGDGDGEEHDDAAEFEAVGYEGGYYYACQLVYPDFKYSI
jgi:hypothetical protein